MAATGCAAALPTLIPARPASASVHASAPWRVRNAGRVYVRIGRLLLDRIWGVRRDPEPVQAPGPRVTPLRADRCSRIARERSAARRASRCRLELLDAA